MTQSELEAQKCHQRQAREKNEAAAKRGKIESVHTTPEKFENGGFSSKTHQMFSVHTTPEEFQNAAPIIGHFKFVFE